MFNIIELFVMSISSTIKISIALCTFNGELYLKEQLESIALQTITPFELVICDDNSTDTTFSIVEQFSAAASFPVRIIRNAKQIGITANFSQALSRCSGDYIALCDQDDIWLPDKLRADYLTISEEEAAYGTTKPLLTHADPLPVDATGAPISNSFMKLRRIYHTEPDPLKNLLVQNFVTGSTTMVNRALLAIALPIPAVAIVHDWWLALVSAAAGNVIFNKQQNVLYRQHGKNAIGTIPFYAPGNLRRILNLPALEKEFAATLKQAISLLARLREKGAHYPHYLEDYLVVLTTGGINAGLYTCKKGITKYGLIRTLVQLLIIFRKRYLDYL